MVVGEVTLIVDGPVIATGLGVVSPWAARVPPASVTLPLMFTALARVWPLALRVPPLRVKGSHAQRPANQRAAADRAVGGDLQRAGGQPGAPL